MPKPAQHDSSGMSINPPHDHTMTRMSLLCRHCYYSGWLRLWLLLLLCSAAVHACTDLLVTPGASQDGAAMIAYNADAPQLFGYLYHYPATNNNNNSNSSAADADVRKIYDWDSGVYLGEIPEVSNNLQCRGEWERVRIGNW